MTAAELQTILDGVVADYVRRLGLRVESVAPGQVTLDLPVSDQIVHAGGVVCGQAIMSAADTAMLVAMIAPQLGAFRPMTTVQLQTSFLRPIPKNCPWSRSRRALAPAGEEPVIWRSGI